MHCLFIFFRLGVSLCVLVVWARTCLVKFGISCRLFGECICGVGLCDVSVASVPRVGVFRFSGVVAFSVLFRFSIVSVVGISFVKSRGIVAQAHHFFQSALHHALSHGDGSMKSGERSQWSIAR